MKTASKRAVGVVPPIVTDGYVYFSLDLKNDHVKIGYSRNPWRRARALQAQSGGHKVVLLAQARGSWATEKRLHEVFGSDRVSGEWFLRSPALDALILFVKEFPSVRSDLARRVLERVA